MVIAAGIAQVNLTKFFCTMLLGRFIRYATLAYLGREYGHEILTIIQKHKALGLVAIVVLGIVIFLFYKCRNRMWSSIDLSQRRRREDRESLPLSTLDTSQAQPDETTRLVRDGLVPRSRIDPESSSQI